MLTQSLVCRIRFDTKSGQVFSLHAPLQAHVLKTGTGLYSVVLGAVNIQDGKNSYYKLQILEHDKKPKWCVIDLVSFSDYETTIRWVFRSWGRVGTTIGGTKLEVKHFSASTT